MQSIGHKPADIVEPKGCKHDLMDVCASIANRFERPQKRVRGSDLVVPVGPKQKQVPHLRVRDQVLEEVQRRGIKPLQIVEKQRERVLRSCEYAEEAPEDQLEAALRVLWRKNWDRRLFSYDKPQFRNQVHNEQSVRGLVLDERRCAKCSALFRSY